MTQDQLIKKFSNTYDHLLKQTGVELLGFISILGEEVLYIIHPLVFDGRQWPNSYHGYTVRCGFSDEEFPEVFWDTTKEEYSFSPFRFRKYVANHKAEIVAQLGNEVMQEEEVLDALCFGNYKEFKENYASVHN
ncbi:MAG: hypothetical protein AB8B61_08565 [Cyclobacteriaceae bacterium]